MSLSAQGKYADAEKEYRAVWPVFERAVRPEHPLSFQACFNLAVCLEAQGQIQAAPALARRAWEGWRSRLALHQAGAMLTRN